MINPSQTFANLFAGMTKTFITKDKDNNYETVDKEITLEDYQDHIKGNISIGVEPRNDSSKCRFALLDFDGHKSNKKDVRPFTKEQIKKIIDKINFLGFPLSVFKSNSGGLHAYLFLDDWYPAADIRYILKKISYALGYERECTEVEIFPKTDVLDNLGKKVNLPYTGGNSRVLLDDNAQEQTFAEFLKIAPSRVTNLQYLEKFKLLDMSKGQHRNERTFAAAVFLKHYCKDWEKKVHAYNELFNDPPLGKHPKDTSNRLEATILKSVRKKDYHKGIIEEAPEELITYSMSAYRALGIAKPNFIIERLIKEKSINFLFGPKGNLKTEYALGMANALVRGKSFMQYECPKPYPVMYADFEMDGYDIIERDNAYLKKYGTEAGEYFHILQWEQQKNQTIPDIASEFGQNLILKRLQHQKKLVGIPPLFILDNLRSASGYNENEADSWRPIGKWLLKLKGLGFPCLVLDHTGYDETHMRGTSSKSDWAYVCLGIKARTSKGSKVAVVDLHFDKARGLRPDETAKFSAQYDFHGNWSIAQSKQEEKDEKLMAEIIVLQAKDPEVKQATLSKALDISTGKVSQLMKKIKKNENY